MSYLVDFDWVLDLLSEVTEAIELLDKLSEDSIAISIITYMEVYQGIVRSPDPNESQEKFDAFLEGVVGVNSEYVRKIPLARKSSLSLAIVRSLPV